MKSMICLVFVTILISHTYAQNMLIELFSEPEGLVSVEPSDYKLANDQLLVSFNKGYVARWKRYACGEACDAAGYFIDTTVDFAQVHLFTLDRKKVLLELMTNKGNEQHCKSLDQATGEISHAWRVNTKENLLSNTDYELTLVTKHGIESNEVSLDNQSGVTIAEKVIGQFCNKDSDVYFSSFLGDAFTGKVFKVLAISDAK